MKVNTTKLVLMCGLALSSMAMTSCKSSESTEPPAPPFQGPQNASFEAGASNWTLVFTLSGPQGLGSANGGSNVSVETGTGFQPTAGIRYASIHGFKRLHRAAHVNVSGRRRLFSVHHNEF